MRSCGGARYGYPNFHRPLETGRPAVMRSCLIVRSLRCVCCSCLLLLTARFVDNRFYIEKCCTYCHSHLVDLALQVVEVFVQTDLNDLINIRILHIGLNAAQSFFGQIDRRPRRSSGYTMQTNLRLIDTVPDGTGKLAVEN